MEAAIGTIIQDSIGLGVLILVLIGVYRLVGRLVSIAELGADRFLNDFTRMADGIASLAKTSRESTPNGPGEASHS